MSGASRCYLLVSATSAESERLANAGPRRDYLELARETGGELLFAEGNRRTKGIVGRVLGPHVRQAWHAASLARDGDRIFADGEHNGIPLALFLRLRRREVRLVMLGHYLSTRWKRRALQFAARIGAPASLLVHSTVQQQVATAVTRGRWSVSLVPYQVDTTFWRPSPGSPRPPGRPLFVAAGSENRDYETLIEAARALPGSDFLVAAGSHWARRAATPGAAPPPDNVEFLREPLDFAALRDCYSRATAVVVPLFDVENQSGVTTILEAMSMGRPVVVSATRGQQECVAGPLVDALGACNIPAAASRGPRHFFGGAVSGTWTGIYVPPGDARALAAALGMLAAGDRTFDAEHIREVATTHFDTGAFTRRLAAELTPN